MHKHITFIFILVSFLFSIHVVASAATQRGIVPVPIIDRSGKQVLLYQESHALLVGVSEYTGGWSNLPGVRKDLDEVRVALEQKGFHTVAVINPTRVELRDAIEKFINMYGQDVDNRLIFYFAGHGHTMKASYGEEMGYFVPADAPNPNIDKSGFMARSIAMQSIELYAKQVQSKHALFLFDSCFSGSIFSLSRAIPENISFKTSKPVRQFITAGSADETVPDESIFNDQLIRALNGEGDLDGDGYLTGVELGEFLNKTVINYSKGSQHPQYGKIRNPNLDKGDFVFSLLDTSAIENSIEVLARERETLEKGRMRMEGERKRKEAAKRLALAKHRLEQERQKVRMEREMLAKIQSFKEQEASEKAPMDSETFKSDSTKYSLLEKLERLSSIPQENSNDNEADGLDSILKAIKNKEKLESEKEKLERELAIIEFERFKWKLEDGLRDISEELARKNMLLKTLKSDISKYNEIINSDFGKDLKSKAWGRLVSKYPEVANGQSLGDSSGLLVALKEIISTLQNRGDMKRKEIDSVLMMKYGAYQYSAYLESSYRKKVDSQLQEKFVEVPKGPRARTIVVSFSVIPNGKINNLKLRQKTGIGSVDSRVLSDVIGSAPFPEFPDELKLSRVDIEFMLRVQVPGYR
jgi:hypothetical protein